MADLEAESAYWADEYFRCYGVRVKMEVGMPLVEAQKIQSAVMRYYVEEMKKVLEEYNGR